MPKYDFDIDKYLDSLTLEELRAAAKIGISVSLRCMAIVVQSLSKFLTSSQNNSLGS